MTQTILPPAMPERFKEPDSHLLTLALYYYTYRDDFIGSYYPETLWVPMLNNYEDHNLHETEAGKEPHTMDLAAAARRP
jgi:hypothetical protein